MTFCLLIHFTFGFADYTWKDEVSSLSRGFVSDYSSKEPNEDFVELLAHYVTFSP
ncbi:putative zinc-binding metallopeptidase, partial [Ornithobacterium rhinotracheale]